MARSRKTATSPLHLTRVFVAFAFLGVSLALRNMRITVPKTVKRGSDVTLACDYDLESAALYSIKWYKHDVEFYRYVPKESPPTQTFDVLHVKVDVSRSNNREVTLTDVQRETSGEFKCEVTADAPLFHTEIRSGKLFVADVPEDGPILSTEVQKVALGAEVKASCITPPSYPPMNVSWFINESEVHPSFTGIQIYTTLFRQPSDTTADLLRVRSTLSLRATQQQFKSGKMRMKCTAKVNDVYEMSDTKEVHEDQPQLALIMVSTATTNNGTNLAPITIHSKLLIVVLWIIQTTYWRWSSVVTTTLDNR